MINERCRGEENSMKGHISWRRCDAVQLSENNRRVLRWLKDIILDFQYDDETQRVSCSQSSQKSLFGPLIICLVMACCRGAVCQGLAFL